MEYPIQEIIDRCSIASLKSERLGSESSEAERIVLMREIENYGSSRLDVWFYFSALKNANALIWDLEADIRKGKEQELGLEEVGRRAIKIREINGIRVKLKNEIAVRAGTFIDEKGNHASA